MLYISNTEKRREKMTRVNVIYDIEPEYIYENKPDDIDIKLEKDKRKNIKVTNKVFEMMKSEGLIKKTNDGYVFVAKYEDVKKLKK